MGGFFSKGEKQNPWIPRAEQAFEKGLFDEAVQNYTKALESEPSNATLWLRLAGCQKYSAKYDAALRSFARTAELNPDCGQAWIQQALLLADAGKFEEAVSAISHVVLPDSETFLKERKCEWLQRCGKYKEAAACAAQLAAYSPTSKQYRILYADLLMRAGMFSESRALYDELAQNTDEDASSYISNAGFCSEMLGDTDGALRRYQNLAEEDSLGWYRRARLEEAAGRFKDAAASYGMVQHYTPAEEISLSVRRALALFWSGNSKDAGIQLEKVLAKGYATPELWYLLGSISFLNGAMKRAAEAYTEYIHLNQSNNTVWYMKGCAEYLSGKYPEAVDSFERMNKISGAPGSRMKWFQEDGLDLFNTPAKEQVKVEVGIVNEGLLSMQAVAFAALGKYVESDKAARMVLDKSPERMDMELLHLRCLAGQGKYQAAYDGYTRISSKIPDDYTVLYEYASAAMVLGKFREAAVGWEKLVSFCPENTIAQSGLIHAAIGMGKYAEAQAAAEALIAAVPNDMVSRHLAGDAALYSGAYDAAAGHYTAFIQGLPDLPAGHIGLGNADEMLGRYAEASEAFSHAASILPGCAGMVMMQARAAAKEGKLDEAVGLYMSVLQNFPETKGAAGEVARLCAVLGRHEDTADAVSYAVSHGESSFDLLKLGADAALALDRIDDAVAGYTDALNLIPGDVQVSAKLGHALVLKGESKSALTYLDTVLAERPEDTDILFDKALALVNLGQFKEAEKTLSVLLDADPENLRAMLFLSDIREQQQDYDGMLEICSRYLELIPTNADIIRKVASICLMKGEYEDALSGYTILLDTNPADQITLRLKAEALAALGEYEEAAVICAGILVDRPKDVMVRLTYANALANAGNSEEALKEYAEVVQSDSGNAAALFSYADLLCRMGEYANAISIFDKLIQLYPRNSLAYVQKALASVRIGEPSAIAANLREASMADPRNSYMLSAVAYMHTVTGHPNEALSFFDKAESAGCHDPDLNCCRALIYISQNRFDLAEKAADAVLQKYPDYLPAWHLKAKALDALGNIREAVACYNKVLELEGTDVAEAVELPEMPAARPPREPERPAERPGRSSSYGRGSETFGSSKSDKPRDRDYHGIFIN